MHKGQEVSFVTEDTLPQSMVSSLNNSVQEGLSVKLGFSSSFLWPGSEFVKPLSTKSGYDYPLSSSAEEIQWVDKGNEWFI